MISLPRPSRIALEKTSDSGDKNGKLYSVKLYSDNSWKAATDVNWIKLEASSGGSADGTDFYYAVSPNETGKTRTGYITVKGTNAADVVTLKFVQSAY